MKIYDSNPLIMGWEEWREYDAVGLAELVKTKHVTPRELARQAAAGIKRVNPSISAVVEVFEDVIDDPLLDGMIVEGFFSGVPCLMKDLGPVMKGRKQEMGSTLMRGTVSTGDSFLAWKLRNAGLNILGRTTTPEFGMCASAENPAVYISRNPWNTEYSTLGSSSGAAAIVATGALPIAHASDGGGSIRLPANANGVIGLKPSRGVLSAAPDGSDLMSLTTASGCITRSVRDTAAFIDECRGAAPGEFMPYWCPVEPYLKLIRRDPKKLKIAVSHEWGQHRASPHIVHELDLAARFLEELGHDVEWRQPDVDFDALHIVTSDYSMARFSVTLDRLLAEKGLSDPDGLIEPMNAKIWRLGSERRAAAFAQIPDAYNKVSRRLGRFFEQWDIILSPVAARSTHKLGTFDLLTLNESMSPDEWYSTIWALYPYTVVANYCGSPAISLPVGVDENGLPMGIQALSTLGNDGLLLQLAAQVERALNGKWNKGQGPRIHV